MKITANTVLIFLVFTAALFCLFVPIAVEYWGGFEFGVAALIVWVVMLGVVLLASQRK